MLILPIATARMQPTSTGRTPPRTTQRIPLTAITKNIPVSDASAGIHG